MSRKMKRLASADLSLDGLRVADGGLLRVLAECAAGASLSQQVPVLVQLDLELRELLQGIVAGVGLRPQSSVSADEAALTEDRIILHDWDAFHDGVPSSFSYR